MPAVAAAATMVLPPPHSSAQHQPLLHQHQQQRFKTLPPAAPQQSPQPQQQSRNYSLRRLARHRITQHLNPYKKQKQQKVEAQKASDESDSLLSFPSTSTSAQNERVNVPIEKAFHEAQLSLRLELTCRELKHVAKEVAEKFDLADTLLLDLSLNSLTELPEFISALTRLKTLVARSNRLGPSLALHICSLQSITYLDLSGNRLSVIPDAFFIGLQQLRILLLAGNCLQLLSPKIVQLAKSLQELNISSNFLDSLPIEIASLTGLRVLNVSDNRLSALPYEIGALQTLAIFDVSYNRLSQLPSSLWRLAASSRAHLSFCVDQNPLVSPPLHVVRRGRQHVGKYLRNLAADECNNNANLVEPYDAHQYDFYRSHGLCNSRTIGEKEQHTVRNDLKTRDTIKDGIRQKNGIFENHNGVKHNGVKHKQQQQQSQPQLQQSNFSSSDGGSKDTPWCVPLSVNTIATPTTIQLYTINGSTVCGTDSGYASTVDEHRFSHEYACTMLNGMNGTAEENLKVCPQGRDSTTAGIAAPLDAVDAAAAKTADRKEKNKKATSVAATMVTTIKAAPPTSHINGKKIGKEETFVDSNNNDSSCDANKSGNDNENFEYSSNMTTKTITNDSPANAGGIHIRYNSMNLNANHNYCSNGLSNNVNRSFIGNTSTNRNGNSLAGLYNVGVLSQQYLMNNGNAPTTTTVLSPLVERNESSWYSTSGELPPNLAITTRSHESFKSTEKSESTKRSSEKTSISVNNIVAKKSLTEEPTEDRNYIKHDHYISAKSSNTVNINESKKEEPTTDENAINKALNSGSLASQPKESEIIRPFRTTANPENSDKLVLKSGISVSSTLPRKKISSTAKRTTHDVLSASNSIDNLSKVKQPLKGSINLASLSKTAAGSNSRLAKCVMITTKSTDKSAADELTNKLSATVSAKSSSIKTKTDPTKFEAAKPAAIVFAQNNTMSRSTVTHPTSTAIKATVNEVPLKAVKKQIQSPKISTVKTTTTKKTEPASNILKRKAPVVPTKRPIAGLSTRTVRGMSTASQNLSTKTDSKIENTKTGSLTQKSNSTMNLARKAPVTTAPLMRINDATIAADRTTSSRASNRAGSVVVKRN